MREIKSTKGITIFTIIFGIVALISGFFSFILPHHLSFVVNKTANDAGSVGVIGGADGPTAIFLSGSTSFHWFFAISALLTVLGITYIITTKHKKNHN